MTVGVIVSSNIESVFTVLSADMILSLLIAVPTSDLVSKLDSIRLCVDWALLLQTVVGLGLAMVELNISMLLSMNGWVEPDTLWK